MSSIDRPLIVQRDGSLLLEVDHPAAEEARAALAHFAQLERSPDHLHSYRVTPLSLWNAAASGWHVDTVLEHLARHSRYALPPDLLARLREWGGRYGRLRLEAAGAELLLVCQSESVAEELLDLGDVEPFLQDRLDARRFRLPLLARGELKQRLIHHGHPVDDAAGHEPGAPLPIALRDALPADLSRPFRLRPYQQAAADAFVASGACGHGVVVLPCGAGKTVVALEVMARLQVRTLILATSVMAAEQWVREVREKTDIDPDAVGLVTGRTTRLPPVSVATYQLLTHRSEGAFRHFERFLAEPFGLLVYDEVHLLPAPIFRLTASLQARRRLGLTATLVREDDRADEVFALIGPRRYDASWKELERQGWISHASCHELRVPFTPHAEAMHSAAPARERHAIAASNPAKAEVVRALQQHHTGEPMLVIGQFLDQLEQIAQAVRAPVLTGRTPLAERTRLLDAFRDGTLPVLVVSKVANFSIDLPDAALCVQVSGAFGSRQEEAQRLGRILRPKERHAYFYSLVTAGSCEEEFAHNRRRFLTEQGYRYTLEDWQGLDATRLPNAHRRDEAAAEVLDLALERRRRARRG